MNFTELGEKVKQKYKEYVMYPTEQLGKRVAAKFPQYTNYLSSDLKMMNEYTNRYGQGEALGYYFSGGTGNVFRQANQFLADRNLPGQVITNALAENREQSPQFQINQKMAQGQPLSPDELAATREQGVQFVAGMSNPLNKTIKPQPTKGVEALATTGTTNPDDFITRFEGGSSANNYQNINKIGEYLQNKYNLKQFDVYNDTPDSNTLKLGMIKIDPDSQGKGVGTKAMNELVAYADSKGKQIVLSPTNEWGTKKKLVEFYQRFGFVPNKNINPFYKEEFIRLPKSNIMASVEPPTKGVEAVNPFGKWREKK